jgi:LmbE family N-acetylglucosaminyl deacetylase
MKNVMVISAHPDDEILGVGGALIRHRDQGDSIHWLIVTNISENHGFEKDVVDSRENEIKDIEKALNLTSYKLGYPTMSLSSRDLISMVPKISSIFQKVQPEIIYVLNRSDAHSDHRVVFDAVMACTKSFRYPYIREVLMYECISETEFAPALPEKAFIPNCFIDISAQFEEKIKLMEIYKTELGAHPFPRSNRNIEALATFRGASCGVEFAEAFQLIKSLRFETI